MDSFIKTIVLLFIYWFIFFKFSLAVDNITATQVLRDDDQDTLESKSGTFKLGFFSPNDTTNRYIGIWYTAGEDTRDKQVVWVANRGSPLTDTSGVLQISKNGNLQLVDGGNMFYWKTNLTTSYEVNSTVATLRDNGNFVLSLNASEIPLWQSFQNPTDTLLPHMGVPFSINTNLTTIRLAESWQSPSDPSFGRYSIGMSFRGKGIYEAFIWNGSLPYWRSGPYSDPLFLGIQMMYHTLNDTPFSLGPENKHNNVSFSTLLRHKATEHYVLSYNGIGYQQDWEDGKWESEWATYQDECDVYGKCGNFGNCNPKNNQTLCSCLKGFVPSNNQEWSARNWSSGCVRNKPLTCETRGGKQDGFYEMHYMKVPDYAQEVEAPNHVDCRSQCLQNCSCLAYAFYDPNNFCMHWYKSLMDIKTFNESVGVKLFIRLNHSELDYQKNRKVIIAVVVVILVTTTLVAALYCRWRWMRQRNRPAWMTTTIEEASFNMNWTGTSGSDVDFQDLPLFKFEDVLAATNNFSVSNKLGQGGFGPVYKGKFGDGQEIAVKRLSRASRQGPQEFMNEVVVISKLQHRNLVRLLGCCVEGPERILVYEFMPNKSLDAFLFDPYNQEHLDWEKRFNIVKGISRGLQYLHRDSRLKIIHRDLKASNILLDTNLHPKISDFGMARIFGGNQDHSDTSTIVGTFGYMAPEYALEGRFSGKSDVFSFGVLLLEVLSGKSNNSSKGDEALTLLGQAWKSWSDGDTLSFVDPRISKSDSKAEIMMCMQLGLMCVQEFPEDRPTISMVVAMIESEVTDLPRPAKPAFTERRNMSWNTSIPYDPDQQSSYAISVNSYITGR